MLGLVERSSGNLVEAGIAYRKDGTIPTFSKKHLHFEAPVCHQGLIQIDTSSGKVGFKQACELPEADCPSFTKYQPGIPPTDNYMQSLAEAREEGKEATRLKERAEGIAADLENKRRRNLQWFIGIVISLMMLVGTFLGLWLKAIATNGQ